jgi:hypothetical protein
MTEILAVVEHGQIKLPASVHLPEGQTVRVAWEGAPALPPLEDEAWTEEEMRLELIGHGKQNPKNVGSLDT